MDKVIILIDDDQDDLDILQETISRLEEDYTCISFQDPVEAVKGITEGINFVPEFIITDYNMLGKTGEYVVQQLRAIPAFAHSCIIVVSTTMNEEMATALMKEGADYCFNKPYSMKEYATLLGSAFSAHSVAKKKFNN